MAHKTHKVALLSSFEIIDEVKLSTRGPTNKHANKSRQVLFLDFYMFC
jgi:hypothetical protein